MRRSLPPTRGLDEWFVQDLNENPVLPLPDRRFDAACQCVSVQYLQQPVAVFRDVLRVLKPQAPLVVTFSNRCFPTKAVAIWQALQGAEQQQLVSLYMTRAGFASVRVGRRPARTRRPGLGRDRPMPRDGGVRRLSGPCPRNAWRAGGKWRLLCATRPPAWRPGQWGEPASCKPT